MLVLLVLRLVLVVPYIGTWIETEGGYEGEVLLTVVPYIGTWIETIIILLIVVWIMCRTLYRYVD